MNRDSDLGVNRSLALLARLREVVADFAERERRLRELTAKRQTAARKHREALARSESTVQTRITETESYYAEEEKRLQNIFEGRRTRIDELRKAALKQLPKHAQREKERYLSDLQLRHFNADRARPEGFKAADHALSIFLSKLSSSQRSVGALEQSAFKALSGFAPARKALATPSEGSPSTSQDAEVLLADLPARLQTAEEALTKFRGHGLAALFSNVPLAGLIPLTLLLGLMIGFVAGATPVTFGAGAGGALVLMGIFFVLFQSTWKKAEPDAKALIAAVHESRRVVSRAESAARTAHEEARRKVQEEYDRTTAAITAEWSTADQVEERFAEKRRTKINAQVPRLYERNARLHIPRMRRLQNQKTARLSSLQSDAGERRRQLSETQEGEMAIMGEEESTQWDDLAADWQRQTQPLLESIAAQNTDVAPASPVWDETYLDSWQPPRVFSPAVKFGRLAANLQGLPQDPRLSLPDAAAISLPMALAFPRQGSLLFEVADSGNPDVIGTLNNTILRMLAITPPGKAAFTIIDPVGLGQNFAGLMHLGDYEETLINRRIWTQRDQIEERLSELNEHIEKVIQMYLRNEFATITEYNAQAGSVAEKYHFLVIADFPANFSESAVKRLQSIAVSGPRCGVFTLIHWDPRQTVPEGFVPDELRKSSVFIRRQNGQFTLDALPPNDPAQLQLDAPPAADYSARLVHKIGKSSVDSNRVEVPFTQVSPPAAERWQGETSLELRVAIGRTGATKLQYLSIGKGTRQHALFAGKTGSGKSTLFHVIITNLALTYSPQQVEFYLIDFKKGVEFKCYGAKRLPHARVVAIESDREFGLSVLQRVDEELKRRGDLFRQLGVQDIAGYQRAGGSEPMPRSLLIIDEFQEFFVQDDAIAQTASMLFDRIVRQGRAFGIHVLLGSQTLGGAYTLARATLGQMVIRVALQCNEADAYLIMDENNPAPRLLSRPGEGIYNDAAGAIEGNSPFQVVWLPDEERDEWLDEVRNLAEQRGDRSPTPIVFEGNAPADVRENDLLAEVLRAVPSAAPFAGRAWLGAPNSIKGPTEAVFRRQSGNHLLIVGQREEVVLTLIGTSLVSLAGQYPVGSAKFVLIDSTPAGTADATFIEGIVNGLPHGVATTRRQDLTEIMNELEQELKTRTSGQAPSDAPEIFVFVHGLQKFKKLRHEDDFDFSIGSDSTSSPGAQFNSLVNEGASHGIHLIATLDTYNNVNRFLSRKALSEFEMRVLFQMSANDSASLIDSPKASDLGLHRAIYYNEQEGHMETFRPYARPDAGWVQQAVASLPKPQENPAV